MEYAKAEEVLDCVDYDYAQRLNMTIAYSPFEIDPEFDDSYGIDFCYGFAKEISMLEELS